jgi:tetratricopeptide (TPR) repeat protein
MTAVKRAILLVLAIGLVTAAVVGVQRFQRERQYREFLAAGDEALGHSNPYAAVEAYSGAIALRPRSMVAFYRRGQAYQLQRQDEQAARDLRRANELAPDATAPLVALGRLYEARGEPAEAAGWYGRAADRLRGEDPSVLYALALARYRSGTPAAARAPVEQAIAGRESSARCYYLLALIERDLNRAPAAIAALQQALQLDRSFVAAREELADLYRVAGRPADELAQLRDLALIDTGPGRQISIALAQARDGRFDDALATLGPDGGGQPPSASLARGRVHLMRAERTLDAREAVLAQHALERAVAGESGRSETLALLGRALDLAGDPARAVVVLRDAVSRRPVASEAFGYLADAAERLGQPAEAHDALASLGALLGDTTSPGDRAERARRMGMLSLRAGEPRRAALELSDAVSAGHDDAPTLSLLADAQWRAGDRALARTTLSRALSLAPDDPALLRLARTIR